jgi:hypothetical protein
LPEDETLTCAQGCHVSVSPPCGHPRWKKSVWNEGSRHSAVVYPVLHL